MYHDNNHSDELQLHIKHVTSYRIQKIEVQRRDAIDQIKIIYDDNTIWYNGHDGGKVDPKCLIMTEGEYLVRVSHEQLYNYNCAAAAVTFETNKGRIFSYQPLRMATKWKNEITTITANEGYEIVSLLIRRGVLLGSEQQPVPPSERKTHPSSWYVIASQFQKEETSITIDNDGVVYEHFHNKTDAFNKWYQKRMQVNEKKGRAAILVDCLKAEVLKTAGSKDAINTCTKKSIKASFCAPHNVEEASITEILSTLYTLFAKRSDLLRVFIISVFLFITHYLSIESQLLTGHLLSLLASNNSNFNDVNHYIGFSCRNVVTCEKTDLSFCKALIVSYIILKVVENIVHCCRSYIDHFMMTTEIRQLSIATFSHVLSLDQKFYDKNSTRQIYESMNVHTIAYFLCTLIPDLFAGILKYIVMAYYLITIDFYLGTFCVVTVFIARCCLHQILRYEMWLSTIERKLNLMTSQIKGDVLSMVSCVKQFSKERYHIDEYRKSQQRALSNLNIQVICRCVRRFLNGMIAAAVFGCSTYYGLHYLKQSKMTAGQLTGFFLILRQFQGVFDHVKWSIDYITREFRDVERFKLLMEEKPSIIDGTLKPEKINGAISFNDVVFEYPSRPGEKVLKGFNLTIQPHKKTAIVGNSGAGKSTIAKLIMRLYDVTSGSITIDGYDVKDYDRKELHKSITIVSQSPRLFNKSLAENIGYGVRDGNYSTEQIDEAVKLSNCGFINKFRAGLDTHAGFGGSQISGGQKQRIAIARAAIRDPDVLILDEATSSLDAENEMEVQEALENVMAERTIIVIAHRLSTIKNADEIICMEDGEVVENGTHDELMAKAGVYHNLILKQLVEKK